MPDACIKFAALFLILTPAISFAKAATAASVISYRVTLETDEKIPGSGSPGKLSALAVEIRLTGNSDGITRLHLPEEFAGQTELWRQITSLTAEGTEISEVGPAVRVLRHKPDAPLVIRYRLVTAYPEEPKAEAGLPNRALIRPTWFAVLGEVVFAVPEGRSRSPATFTWGAHPSTWVLVSDLDHQAPLTLETLVESFLFGGTDVRVSKLEVAGGPVRLAMRGGWKFSDHDLADLLTRVVVAERQFWEDANTAFFVPLVPLAPLPEGTMHAGIGRGDAFVLYSTTNSALDGFRWELAHEHMHTWIPNQIGGLPVKDEALDYWFSEGFADFYAARVLLHSGIWSLEDFVAEENEMLERYGNSPAPIPNMQILKKFWTTDTVRQLAYDRGRMLATLWDYRLRHSAGHHTLNEVLKRQRVEAQENQRNGQDATAAQSFIQVYEGIGGISLAEDVKRFVEEGQRTTLPPDLYGACARIENGGTDGKPSFQKVTLTPGMLESARTECVKLMGNL